MSANKTKWIPLESNPEVFNKWAYAAGLVRSQAHFEDIYGLDDELLQLVTPGATAVCLCFPCKDAIDDKSREEDAKFKQAGQTPVDPTVFWMKQTISNACGTMALIHALANSDWTISPASPLATFIDDCKEKTPVERANLLETTSLFEEIHASAANSGQTDAARADMNTELHFITFVRAPAPSERAHVRKVEEGVSVEEPGEVVEGDKVWRLVELDGRRMGPIDRGDCTDLVKDAAKYVKDFYVSQAKSVEFSMMALCPGPPA
ncbi:hypothetical protein V8B97DRAFT_1915496 [Scleroderma yunnanense]